MPLLTQQVLEAVFPNTKKETLAKYLQPLINTCEKYNINTKQRMGMFLAQVGHESMGLSVVTENLNYSADRLVQVFPKYFSGGAASYHRQPEKIANRVYANRMGNGPESSGDGWKYRGKGLIQVTGKYNTEQFAKAIGKSTDDALDYLLTPEGAAESAGWYWNSRKLNVAADKNDITSATKLINGGTIGLKDRQYLYTKALKVL